MEQKTSGDERARSPNGTTFSQFALFFVFATALPLSIILSVEVWMATVYTGGFHLQAFRNQYFNGVFQYRILGRDILLQVYSLLNSHFADRPYPLPRDTSASFLFYAAFALSNGVYLAISNVLLLTIMWVKRRGLRDQDLSLFLYYTLLLTLSMAVVTPYDQLAYLLLLVGIGGLQLRSPLIGYLAVGISAVAGILNRETEFLLAAFLASLAMFSTKNSAKKYSRYLIFDCILSGATYLVIHVVLPGKLQVIQNITFGGKWALESLVVGAMLFTAAALMALRIHDDMRPMLAFLALSTPYIVPVFLSGALRELRLIVPLVLCMFCLYLFLSRSATSSPGNEKLIAT